MRFLVPLIAVLLAGCLGGCGLHPSEVTWRDPDFAAALLEAPAPGWTVQTIPARPGLPSDDPTLGAWNATVQGVSHDLGDHLWLGLDASGRLTIRERIGPEPEGLLDRVTSALAEVTDGNQSEREAWAEELLEEPRQVGFGEGHGGEGTLWAYESTLPTDRVRLDGILAGNVPDEPSSRFAAGAWTVRVSLPTVQASRGHQLFAANPDGENRFEDGSWQGEFPEQEALAGFEAAYESLGVGAPPEDAGVGGAIC